MNLKTAECIWEQIRKTKYENLKESLVVKALEYAHIRANWYLMDSKARAERDASRTIAHDAFIDTCNILSRNMGKAGEGNSWRADLGDNRKEIGDFACWLHALLGIGMR